jgi:tRNA G26 N,N-dimethylase Trm1
VLRHFVWQRRQEIADGKFKRPRLQQRPPAGAAAAAAASDEAGASGQPAAGQAGGKKKPPFAPYKPSPDIRILEGLAASGLRSIRYALEVTLRS